MAQLKEVMLFDYNIVESEKKRPGVLMTVSGVLQRFGTKNANGRIYSEKLWDKVLNNKAVRDSLDNRAMVGELDHPSSGRTSMSNISHIVTSNIKNPNGTISGEVDILDTPMGRIAETLFKAGVRVGISSRGNGSVTNKNGVDYVDENNFKLETYDLVIKPSTPGAYLSEEDNSDDNRKIFQSVSELVNNTDDSKVLLEAFKLISFFEESNEQEALADSIQEKLNNILESTKNEECNMSTENKNVDSQVVDLARDLSAKQIEESNAKHKEEIAQLTKQISELSASKEQLARNLEEANSNLDSLKDIEEKFNSANEELEAAKSLTEESLQKLEELKDIEKRYEAAEKILVEITKEHAKGLKESKIEAIISLVVEEQKDAVKAMLDECEDVDAVSSMWENLKKLIKESEFVNNGDPLPNDNVEVDEEKEDTSVSDIIEEVVKNPTDNVLRKAALSLKQYVNK